MAEPAPRYLLPLVFSMHPGQGPRRRLVRNKAIHRAGVLPDGANEILASGLNKLRAPNSGCAS